MDLRLKLGCMDPYDRTLWDTYARLIRRYRPSFHTHPALLVGPEGLMLSVVQAGERLGMPRPHRVETLPSAMTHVQLEPTALLVLSVRDDPSAISACCDTDSELPILTLSLSADPQLMADCLQAGATAHISLPTVPDRWADALLHAAVIGSNCTREQLEGALSGTLATVLAGLPSLPSLGQLSDVLIAEALKRSGGVTSQAARLLNVTPQAIFNRRRRAREGESQL